MWIDRDTGARVLASDDWSPGDDPIRTVAFDGPDIRLVRETIPAGGTTARHAHDREAYAAVLDGRLRVEFDDGPVAVDAGEFLRVPAGLVHRDVNPDDATQAYLLWLVGSEPRTVRVDGPGSGA